MGVFSQVIPMHEYLTPYQLDELHKWLAMGLPYHELKKRMTDHWHMTITSQACSWHRRKYADRIASYHKHYAAAQRRKDLDKQRKQIQRAADHRHCATCQCYTIPPVMA